MKFRWVGAAVCVLIIWSGAVGIAQAGRGRAASAPKLTSSQGTYLGADSWEVHFDALKVDANSQHVIALARSNVADRWGLSDQYDFLMQLNYAGQVLRRWYIGQLGSQVVPGPNGTLFFVGTQRVMVLDMATLRVIRRFVHPAGAGYIALAGGRIWMTGLGRQGIWSRPLYGYQKWTYAPTNFTLDGIASPGPYSPFLYDAWQDVPARNPVLLAVNGAKLTPLPNKCGWPNFDDAPEILPMSGNYGAIGTVTFRGNSPTAWGLRICRTSSSGITRTGTTIFNPLGPFSGVTVAPSASWVVFSSDAGDQNGLAIMRRDGSSYRIILAPTVPGYPHYDSPDGSPTVTADGKYMMWISRHDGPQSSADAFFHSITLNLTNW